MEVIMFRKVLIASVVGVMLTGTLVATSANAASVSNGVPCPSANKTTKIAGGTYKCAKNPTVKNAKLTWVSMDCLNADTAYVKTNKSYLLLAGQMPATLAALDEKIAAEVDNAALKAIDAAALDVKVATWNQKLTEFTAARDAMVADSANATKNRKSITTYNTAITSLKTAIRSATSSAANYRKVGKTVDNMKTTRANAVLNLAQAKDGVAQALSMRALVCQKGL